jgi:hypothetical protein
MHSAAVAAATDDDAVAMVTVSVTPRSGGERRGRHLPNVVRNNPLTPFTLAPRDENIRHAHNTIDACAEAAANQRLPRADPALGAARDCGLAKGGPMGGREGRERAVGG